MASEQELPELPADLDAWLTSHAEATDRSKAAVLAHAVVAYRLLDDADEEATIDAALSTYTAQLETLDSRLEELEATVSLADQDGQADTDRLDAVEQQVEDRFEELKTRIIDVLKETRNRAPADHSHSELTEQIEALREEHSALAETHQQLESTVETGLENAETAQTALTDVTDRLETRSDRLAGAVVDLRRRISRIEQLAAQQDALDTLLKPAHAAGITAATCDSCDNTVQLGLLTTARCPHCAEHFDELQPRRFFRKPLLTVSDRLALEAGKPPAPSDDLGAPSDSKPKQAGDRDGSAEAPQ